MSSRLTIGDFDFLELLALLPLPGDVIGPADSLDNSPGDADDLPVPGTLLAAGADALVTGDKDLQVLASHYPILTPAEFCRRSGL